MNTQTTSYQIRERSRGLVCWNTLWLLLFFIGTGIYFIVMPKYMDDYWYMEHLRSWFAGQGIDVPENGGNILEHGIPWDAFLQTWGERYYTDNVRWGNIVVLFFLLLPKWVGSGLMTLLWIYTIVCCLRLVGDDWRKSELLPLALFLWTYGILWGENLGSLDYQFNYLLSMSIGMYLIMLLMNRGNCDRKVKFWWLVFIGLLLGMSHEGVAVPVGTGLAGLMFVSSRYRTRELASAVAGVFVGVVLIMTVPGMISRTAGTVEFAFKSIVNSLSCTIIVPFLLFVALYLISVFRKSSNCIWNDGIVVFCLVSAAASLAIEAMTDVGPRGGIWMGLIAVPGLLRILYLNHISFLQRRSWWILVVSGVLLVSVYLRLVFLDVETFRFRKAYLGMCEWYSSEQEGSYFDEYAPMSHRPAICGYMPEHACFQYNIMYLESYYRKYGARKYAAIIPDKLREVDLNAGVEVRGDSGIREKDGYYFMPIDNRDDSSVWVDFVVPAEYDYGDGYVGGGCWAIPFRSEKDGEWYRWIIPWRGWYVSHFMELKGMKMK